MLTVRSEIGPYRRPIPAQRCQNNVCTGTKTQVPCTNHMDLRYSIRARF
jgi:hypothetical protein